MDDCVQEQKKLIAHIHKGLPHRECDFHVNSIEFWIIERVAKRELTIPPSHKYKYLDIFRIGFNEQDALLYWVANKYQPFSIHYNEVYWRWKDKQKANREADKALLGEECDV